MTPAPAQSVPQFARTPAGREKFAQGWLDRADYYRREARAFGLTPEQRQIMRSLAQAAQQQAAHWRRLARQAAKAA